VVHISDGKDSQTVKDFVETLEQQNGKKEQVIPFSKIKDINMVK
jgi:hypothetical protein